MLFFFVFFLSDQTGDPKERRCLKAVAPFPPPPDLYGFSHLFLFASFSPPASKGCFPGPSVLFLCKYFSLLDSFPRNASFPFYSFSPTGSSPCLLPQKDPTVFSFRSYIPPPPPHFLFSPFFRRSSLPLTSLLPHESKNP